MVKMTFFKKNWRLLSFGLLLTFFSSFGQTFLISLYVPKILDAFDLSNGGFGAIYALSTIASAATLTWIGKMIDTADLKKYTLLIIAGLFISLLVLALAQNIVQLVISIWGLRLFGQGLFSHISLTTMARYFDQARGKAISIASLGHPLGEAVFPTLIAAVIAGWGWRNALFISAASLVVVLPLYVTRAVKTIEPDNVTLEEESGKVKNQKQWTYKMLFTSKAFYLIAPNVFILGFLNTGLVFYQLSLAEFKGWSTEWMAFSFIAFAVASSLAIIAAGFLVDKYTAARLFPFYLFPYGMGILVMFLFSYSWIAPVYYFLLGISQGFGSTLKSALQAELFGTRSIGAVRSLFTMLMVISTSLGPAAMGIFLDVGFNFNFILLFSLLLVLIAILQSFRIMPITFYQRILSVFRTGK